MIYFKRNSIVLLLVLFMSTSFSLGQSAKPVVGIGKIDYAAGRGGNITSFYTELEGNLLGTKKFEIIERGRLGEILKERGLSAAGIVDGNSSMGGIGGVDYLIYGTIISIDLERSSSDSDYYTAKGTMAVKVVDVNTGRIVMNSKIQDDVFEKGSDTATSELRRVLCKKIAKDLAFQIFPIKIAQVQGDKVYINYGEYAINTKGAYEVVELGGGFMDPDTGELLGAEETLIWAVEIVSIHSSYSIGKIKYRRGEIKIGDKLKWLSTKKWRAVRKKHKIK